MKVDSPCVVARNKIMALIEELPPEPTCEEATVVLAKIDEILERLYQQGYANSIKPAKN